AAERAAEKHIAGEVAGNMAGSAAGGVYTGERSGGLDMGGWALTIFVQDAAKRAAAAAARAAAAERAAEAIRSYTADLQDKFNAALQRITSSDIPGKAAGAQAGKAAEEFDTGGGSATL
ncbi:unnamed protein product, partial [Ectocarpus sp. 13 AM-2016]